MTVVNDQYKCCMTRMDNLNKLIRVAQLTNDPVNRQQQMEESVRELLQRLNVENAKEDETRKFN